MSLFEKYITTSALALTLIIILIYWLWSRRHLYAFALHYPGRLGLPIIGIIHKIKNVDYLLTSSTKLFDECKASTVFTWYGLQAVLITQDPVVAEKILNSSKLLTKAITLYTALNDALQGGILTSPVSEWRFHRKLINPVFKQKVLLSFFPIFNKAKNAMIKRIESLTKSEKNNEVNAPLIVTKTMLTVASQTIMGRQRELEENDFKNFTEPYILIFRIVTNLTIHAFLNTYRIFKFDRTYTKLLNTLRSFVTDGLHERLQENKENQQIVTANVEKSDEKPMIFIDQVFQLWKDGKYSWQNVISESNTMMIASVETTANALFSAIVMLAMHPFVQKRLYEDLSTVFHDNDIDVEYEHLTKLPYLDMVIQETLRLAPSVPLIGRQITEATEISEGIIVPKGVEMMISIFHIHRNKDFWGPNADKFDPDNFLPDNQAKRNPHAYMPFSKGTRNCIGSRYAMYALKTMLIGLVLNYEFDTEFKYEDLEFVSYLTLAYKREPPIKIISRAGRS